MIFLFLVYFAFSTKFTYGVWDIEYYRECNGTVVADLITSNCIFDKEKYLSYYYACDDKENRTITMNYYHGSNCEGEMINKVYFGVEGECNQVMYKKFGKFFCVGNYEVDFASLEFEVPYFPEDSDVGSPSNPVHSNIFIPVTSKCFHFPSMNIHLSATCEGENAEVKIFKTGLCLLPIHTVSAKKGEVVNVNKVLPMTEDDKFWKFVGCKTV